MEYSELLREEDTIVAIATPHGSGGIGVVRVSGLLASGIMRALFRPASGEIEPVPRYLYYGWIEDPHTNEQVDEVLAVFMKSPASYTAEDVVEFQCHSGPALLDRVVRLCLASGARLAEPGEFTRRAFLNGRIDLAQAEAVAELAFARSMTSGRLAMNMLQGGLYDKTEQIRLLLLDILASIEAAIDYPDESDQILEGMTAPDSRLESVLSMLDQLISDFERSRIYREGVAVVIAGRANAGKSSLLNALANEERAIVTPVPGTTRDAIDAEIMIEDICVRLIDTAGIRLNPDEIEEIGISRVEKIMSDAALVLWVMDASVMPDPDDSEAGETIIRAGALDRTLLVFNKSDIAGNIDVGKQVENVLSLPLPFTVDILPHVTTSALTGEGLKDLEDAIAKRLRGERREPLEIAPTARQKDALMRVRNAVIEAMTILQKGMGPELASVDVRRAYDILGCIRGESITSDILDHVFSTFCLGK